MLSGSEEKLEKWEEKWKNIATLLEKKCRSKSEDDTIDLLATNYFRAFDVDVDNSASEDTGDTKICCQSENIIPLDCMRGYTFGKFLDSGGYGTIYEVSWEMKDLEKIFAKEDCKEMKYVAKVQRVNVPTTPDFIAISQLECEEVATIF